MNFEVKERDHNIGRCHKEGRKENNSKNNFKCETCTEDNEYWNECIVI